MPPNAHAHVLIPRPSERNCVKSRSFLRAPGWPIQVTGLLVGRDEITDTHRDDDTRTWGRRPSVHPREASGRGQHADLRCPVPRPSPRAQSPDREGYWVESAPATRADPHIHLLRNKAKPCFHRISQAADPRGPARPVPTWTVELLGPAQRHPSPPRKGAPVTLTHELPGEACWPLGALGTCQRPYELAPCQRGPKPPGPRTARDGDGKGACE